MSHLPSSLALLALISMLSGPAVASPPGPRQNEQKQRKAEPKSVASLTGCVDEQDGHYILTDDREMKPIADLVADGFPAEGFAKHVGHKVTVRGVPVAGDARPVFKVRSIETVSETCEPRSETQP
jgi:hypothetical protein